MKKNRSRDEEIFGLAKVLSWSSLVLILISGLGMSFLLANFARQTMQDKLQEYSYFQANNLNQLIYKDFTLPTVHEKKRVDLTDEEQYRELDELIKSATLESPIDSVRIFSVREKIVRYSTNKEDEGRSDLADNDVLWAIENDEHQISVIKKKSSFDLIFSGKRQGGVALITTYPMLVLIPELNEVVNTGILQISQDITADSQTVLRFQWMIIGVTLLSSLLLFLVLNWLIRRVSRINAQRLNEKEQLERELMQSERLASMGRMVAGIAHEIRNPLGIIRSSSELLLKKNGQENSSSSRILEAIHNESKRLSQTVNEFLDYAKPKPPKQELLDVSKVLDQALIFLESEFTKRDILVDKQFHHGLHVMGDKDLLYRAVYNILTNSIQAMEGAGTITVVSHRKNGRLVLIFRDSGPGFAEESMDDLLEPFFTTKDHGTGLGLTLVNNIVKSHGGDLELSNQSGGGAEIRIRLSLADDPKQPQKHYG